MHDFEKNYGMVVMVMVPCSSILIEWETLARFGSTYLLNAMPCRALAVCRNFSHTYEIYDLQSTMCGLSLRFT